MMRKARPALCVRNSSRQFARRVSEAANNGPRTLDTTNNLQLRADESGFRQSCSVSARRPKRKVVLFLCCQGCRLHDAPPQRLLGAHLNQQRIFVITYIHIYTKKLYMYHTCMHIHTCIYMYIHICLFIRVYACISMSVNTLLSWNFLIWKADIGHPASPGVCLRLFTRTCRSLDIVLFGSPQIL